MSQDEDTKIAILEVNLSHIAKRIDAIEDIQKSMQQLIMQESRNRHDIEALQRDKSELKAEMDQIRDDLKEFRSDVYSTLKVISESVNNNSFVSKAILTISGIAAGAVVTAVINIWISK